MNNAILLLPPAINVVVTGLFAGVVLRQYIRRHRVYQLYWSIALSMAFLATLAYIFMIITQQSSNTGISLFRMYYIFGAALMPAWLGLGSLALVSGPRVTRPSLIILSILSIIAAVLLLTANVDRAKLSHIAGTPGTGILHPGAWLVMIVVLNTAGVIAVVGVALYSGWKLAQRQSNTAGFQTRNLLWANLLVVAGDLLNAAAGSLARILGMESTFWLIMATGWIVFFSGVLLTNRRPRIAPLDVSSQETRQTLASS